MNSVIRNCLPPDRNPRKPKVVLPKGSIDTHVHVFVRIEVQDESGPRLQPAGFHARRPQAPAQDARRRPRGVHPAVDLRHRQFRDPRRHDRAQRRDAEPRALRRRHHHGHHRQGTGRAQRQGRARRAAQHRQQGRHADRLRPDRRARGAHPAVQLAHRMAVSRQGHCRADAGAQEDQGAAVDRPLRLSAGEGHGEGAGLPGAARPDAATATPG